MEPTDREAELLDAMVEDPDDEDLRTVFADVLLGRGNEWGELIHLHSEIEDESNTPRVARGRKLMHELTKQITACGGELHDGLSHGWIWHLTIDTAAFLENLPLLFAIGPIHHVRLHNAKPYVDKLAECRHLRWVFKLEMGANRLSADDAEMLAQSPHFARIRGLNIHNNPLGPRGAASLLDGRLTRLRTLDIGFAQLGPEGVAALAASPQLPGLEELHLVSNEASVETTTAMLAAARELQQLWLSYNRQLGDEGASAIAQATHLDKLSLLSVPDCSIGDRGVEALASAPHLGKLTWLSLKDNLIGRRGARALAASTVLSSQCRLHVTNNRRIDAESRRALEARFRMD